MIDQTLKDRAERLAVVALSRRQATFPLELTRVTQRANAAGMLHSSRYVLEAKALIETELDARAIQVWQAIVRAHKALGSGPTLASSSDFKALFTEIFAPEFRRLGDSLDDARKISGTQMAASLESKRDSIIATHDIEIDVYFDTLASRQTSQSSGTMPTYNFYGTVGAVQTGANAVANNVQNLSTDDRASLIDALNDVLETLQSVQGHETANRDELISLTREVQSELDSVSPNSTKLKSIFVMLATAVQGIASARPAYEAMQRALEPLGITLP